MGHGADHLERRPAARPKRAGVSRGRILVALSGGVDSSVVAACLLQEGFEVLAATLRMQPSGAPADDRACSDAEAVEKASAVADHLGIPHEVLDCSEVFAARVLHPAWEEYAAGRTPSPCVHCNREIKFGLLADLARQRGALAVATGHYARIEHPADGDPVLRRGLDRAKDQSYFLCGLSLDQLRGIRLPLGGRTKAEVRALARVLGLPTAERGESQDACFALDGLGFPESLRRRFGAPARTGSLLDPSGRLLGTHGGLHRYTIGQRRGLGLALGTPARVVELREADAAVILSTDPVDLMAGGLLAVHPHWFTATPSRCEVQIRSRHAAAPATLEVCGEDVRVRFDRPQSAVTPGQAVAFYSGDRLLGGAWILQALR